MLNKLKCMLMESRKKHGADTKFLSMLYSDAQKIGKNDSNRQTTDSEVISFLKKVKKANDDSLIIALNNSRLDIVDKCRYENAIINSLLPVQMTRERLVTVIGEAIEVTDSRSVGDIMKYLKKYYDGLYDGKEASTIIKSII